MIADDRGLLIADRKKILRSSAILRPAKKIYISSVADGCGQNLSPSPWNIQSIHRMQIWRPSRQAPGSRCVKERLVWTRSFDLTVLPQTEMSKSRKFRSLQQNRKIFSTKLRNRSQKQPKIPTPPCKDTTILSIETQPLFRCYHIGAEIRCSPNQNLCPRSFASGVNSYFKNIKFLGGNYHPIVPRQKHCYLNTDTK